MFYFPWPSWGFNEGHASLGPSPQQTIKGNCSPPAGPEQPCAARLVNCYGSMKSSSLNVTHGGIKVQKAGDQLRAPAPAGGKWDWQGWHPQDRARSRSSGRAVGTAPGVPPKSPHPLWRLLPQVSLSAPGDSGRDRHTEAKNTDHSGALRLSVALGLSPLFLSHPLHG